MKEKYNEWLKKVNDKTLKDELIKIEKSDEEIANRFFKDLEFGTGGLRGIIGVGTNCLNIHTIARATEGVARYMLKFGGKRVAVSFDSRINSKLFAETSAAVFASFGIEVVIAPELMPTPYLSYITREYKCAMGIMVTASHNPAKYNGYKVYGSDGCQVTDNAANEISKEIAKVKYFETKYDSFDSYVKAGLIRYSEESVERKYLDYIKSLRTGEMNNLSLMYTPLNGTGYRIIPKLLRERGIAKLDIVSEQSMPDGNFPTCSYPNPEKKEALKLGLEAAKKAGSDMLLATDPDADRVGIAVLHGGEYVLMTGNEVGVLLADYMLSKLKAEKRLPSRPVIIKTIVTTNLIASIAKDYDATVINVLTGFKYIGEQIAELEAKGEEKRFILGFEESYGYLIGTAVRDKDSVVATQVICEMAASYKKEGKTLVDVLNALYKKYGKFEHKLYSFEFAGASGNQKMKELMAGFRSKPFKEFAGFKVLSSKDYMADGTGLPKSNVLSYDLDGGTEVIMRPSGTEPLIKIYLTVSRTEEENAITIQKVADYLKSLFA